LLGNLADGFLAERAAQIAGGDGLVFTRLKPGICRLAMTRIGQAVQETAEPAEKPAAGCCIAVVGILPTRSAPSAMISGFDIFPPGTALSKSPISISLQCCSVSAQIRRSPPQRYLFIPGESTTILLLCNLCENMTTLSQWIGRNVRMSVIGWIVLGLVAGFIGSKIVNKSGQGLIFDIVLGIVGAVAGGYIFSLLGATGVTGFNIYSLIVAVIGSVVVLWLYHAITGNRSA
jgi:uncharacterized membrane protein YeaQ/YmgE (transglycosylase-associated protein family)